MHGGEEMENASHQLPGDAHVLKGAAARLMGGMEWKRVLERAAKPETSSGGVRRDTMRRVQALGRQVLRAEGWTPTHCPHATKLWEGDARLTRPPRPREENN